MFHDDTIGDRWLSAWLVAPGVCWVQTRSPLFARKLSQRADSCLVSRGVAGGYLRIFAFQSGLAWARNLLARYTRNDEPTNERFLSPEPPTSRRNLELAVRSGRGNRTQQTGDGNNN